MNRPAQLRGLCLSFLLALISLSFTGCGGRALVNVPPDTHLEKYRRVYLMEPTKGDPRSVTPRMLGRLRKAGFDVTQVSPDVPLLGQGSGFVVTPEGDVLTCAHVVGPLTNATVWINGTRFPCNVVVRDTNTDLALLHVDADHLPFRPIPFDADNRYAMGQDVFTMGFPLAAVLGSEPRLNKGLISATVGINDDPKFLQVSAAVQPGNSGGPLLNSRGEAIGVIAKTLDTLNVAVQTGVLPQNVNFATKIGVIRAFLVTHNITLPTTGPTDEGFEATKKSLALVRTGIVTEAELKKPALVCVFGYVSVPGIQRHFSRIAIAFVDLKTGEAVYKIGQSTDDRFSSEDGTLDKLFGDIAYKFFPGRQNPFW